MLGAQHDTLLNLDGSIVVVEGSFTFIMIVSSFLDSKRVYQAGVMINNIIACSNRKEYNLKFILHNLIVSNPTPNYI